MGKTLKLILKESDNKEEMKETNILGIETADEKAAKADSKEKGLLSEDIDTGKDENDTTDEVVDDIQDETPAEEEEKDNVLDNQLADLREILPDLDLNLYQITSKEDKNKIFYFIGKVDDDSADVLMLVDTKPQEEDLEEPKENTEVKEIDSPEQPEPDEEPTEEAEENRFDLVKIPITYDEFIKLNPRYGDELNPDHEAIMDYLMKCLVKENPERAEELQKDEIEDDNTQLPLDSEVQDELDDKIEHYNDKINKD